MLLPAAGLLATGQMQAVGGTFSAPETATLTQQQRHTVSGTVVDEMGEPIIGANILVKGTATGTTTDLDGHFSLEAGGPQVTLVISYIGYKRLEVAATAGQPLNLRMEPEDNLMDEVVVTGYGTFKKSAYAGSASNVKGEKMQDVPAVSFKDMPHKSLSTKGETKSTDKQGYEKTRRQTFSTFCLDFGWIRGDGIGGLRRAGWIGTSQGAKNARKGA